MTENGAGIPEGNFEIEQFQLTPKTVANFHIMGHLINLQATYDVEQRIRFEMAKQTALACDLAAISGSGGLEPLGLLNTPGVGSIALGANGADISFEALVDLRTTIAAKNARMSSLSYLTNAAVRGKLEKTFIDSPGTGITIWKPHPEPKKAGEYGSISGYQAAVSNQIPSNLTKGTGTNLSAIIYGAWESLCFGEWNVYQVLVDPYSLADKLQTRFISYFVTDMAPEHPEEFAFINDAVTT